MEKFERVTNGYNFVYERTLEDVPERYRDAVSEMLGEAV